MEKAMFGDPKCGSCKYVIDHPQAGVFCCRYPPTPIMIQNKQGGLDTQSVFPPVNPAMTWCGEHTPKIHFNS